MYIIITNNTFSRHN